MQTDNANAVRVCLVTGLRIGDVLALRRANLGADGKIRTTCAKTGKTYEGEIAAGLAREILRRAGSSDFVFPSPKQGCEGKHRTRQAVWRDIKQAAKRCATPRNVTPHSARKIYAVDKFRKEGLPAAQEALQHDRLEVTLLYAFSDILAKDHADVKNDNERDQTARTRDDDDIKNDIKTDGARDLIIARFFDAFGGRDRFADCLASFIRKNTVSE